MTLRRLARGWWSIGRRRTANSTKTQRAVSPRWRYALISLRHFVATFSAPAACIAHRTDTRRRANCPRPDSSMWTSAFNFLLALLIFAFNLLVLVAISSDKHLHSTTHLLSCNLWLCNCISAIVTIFFSLTPSYQDVVHCSFDGIYNFVSDIYIHFLICRSLLTPPLPQMSVNGDAVQRVRSWGDGWSSVEQSGAHAAAVLLNSTVSLLSLLTIGVVHALSRHNYHLSKWVTALFQLVLTTVYPSFTLQSLCFCTHMHNIFELYFPAQSPVFNQLRGESTSGMLRKHANNLSVSYSGRKGDVRFSCLQHYPRVRENKLTTCVFIYVCVCACVKGLHHPGMLAIPENANIMPIRSAAITRPRHKSSQRRCMLLSPSGICTIATYSEITHTHSLRALWHNSMWMENRVPVTQSALARIPAYFPRSNAHTYKKLPLCQMSELKRTALGFSVFCSKSAHKQH